MLRELTPEEMEFVSGGDIVVTAPTGGLSEADRHLLRQLMMQEVGYTGGGGGGGGGGSGDGSGGEYSVTVPIGEPVPSDSVLVDTDGDGVPDSPDIVITATPEQIQAAKDAFKIAQNDVTIFKGFIEFLIGAKASTGGLSGGAQAVGQSFTLDQLYNTMVEAQAEYRYQQDRIDGTTDGFAPTEHRWYVDPYL